MFYAERRLMKKRVIKRFPAAWRNVNDSSVSKEEKKAGLGLQA